jgi:hypothetical protein
MEYNLDENSSLLEILGLKSPNKVISIGQRIAVKHYSMYEYAYAFVVDINKSYIRVKFRTSLPELDFFPEDPVVLNFVDDEKLFMASGEIVSIESIDPLTIEIKVNKVEKKDTLRKYERFYVSLSSSIVSKESEETIFGIIKNLSFSGFKVNCKKDLPNNSNVEITVNIDKYYNISCSARIVRKNKLSLYYEYGMEISDISKTNMLTFQHYINQLKAGTTI